MSVAPSADLTVYTKEQAAQDNNPYRKIAKKIDEMAEDDTFAAEDRKGLAELAATFKEHQRGLALRAQHLLASGIDPEKNPEAFYHFINDNRNKDFYPAGITLYWNDPRHPKVENKFGLSQEAARAVLEKLGFIGKDETMDSVAARIPGRIQRNPRVASFYLEKVDPDSSSRVVGGWEDDPNNGHGMIWLENKQLGEGVVAGIGVPMKKGSADHLLVIENNITNVTIRIEGSARGGIATLGANILRAAP